MKNLKNIGIIGSIAALCLIVVGVVVIPSVIQEKKLAHIKEFVSDKNSETNNIAEEWDWNKFSNKEINTAIQKAENRGKENKEESHNEGAFEFDVVVLYSALATVGIDDNGEVIVDSKALEALENAFSTLPDELSDSEMEELLQLIKTGLPGVAGEQTAEVVDRFQRYKIAEKDFNSVMPEPKNVDEALALFDRKVALRESILGLDVADKLYSQEQAQSRHMLKLMAISGDKTLSNEEKKAQIEAFNAESDLLINNYSMKNPRDEDMVENNVVILRQLGVDETKISAYRMEHLGEEKASLFIQEEENKRNKNIIWAERYAKFVKEKQQIMSAELSQVDKNAQVEALLREHYDASELEKARLYDQSQGNVTKG
ncbi:MAG: lipase secretion chaperone [Cellvibrionaceae bacterium]